MIFVQSPEKIDLQCPAGQQTFLSTCFPIRLPIDWFWVRDSFDDTRLCPFTFGFCNLLQFIFSICQDFQFFAAMEHLKSLSLPIIRSKGSQTGFVSALPMLAGLIFCTNKNLFIKYWDIPTTCDRILIFRIADFFHNFGLS